MIFSCIGDDTDKKTAEQITQDIHNMYPGPVDLIEQADVEASLDPTNGFFLPFGLVAQDQNPELYYAYPFVFGMGDANYAFQVPHYSGAVTDGGTGDGAVRRICNTASSPVGRDEDVPG